MPKKGQLKGTPARRAAFIAHLRAIGPDGECVFWPWSDTRDGYVRIFVNGKKVLAHRWVYEQLNGPLPVRPEPNRPGASGMVVCHTCDQPACVRHLWLGTQGQNMGDASAKGRMPGGSYHGGSARKLSEVDVARIRTAQAGGVRQADLARTFGVSQAHISQIVHGNRRKP